MSSTILTREVCTARGTDVKDSPDFTNTEPASQIGPFPQWGDPKKIVAMDPYGHLAPWIFKDTIEQEDGRQPSVSRVGLNMLTEGTVDIRPTIAITKAHMKVSFTFVSIVTQSS